MLSASFIVRAVTPQDIAAWCSLRRLLWQHISDDDHFREAERQFADQNRFATFVAFSRKGEPVGFAEATVRHDYVNGCKRKDFNGHGLGSFAIDWCANQVSALNRRFVRLGCDARNKKLCAYYESLGFVRLGIMPTSGHGGDYIDSLYEKVVDQL
jgi:RimJ/RimL family protein N-acetyltransferase